MSDTSVQVFQAEDGQWVVRRPGGAEDRFTNKAQAEAFANAFRVVCVVTSSTEVIQSALRRLEQNGLSGTEIGRKLRSMSDSANNRIR